MTNNIDTDLLEDRRLAVAVDSEEIVKKVSEKLIRQQAPSYFKSLNGECNKLIARLEKYYEYLKSWELHHDFEMWEQAESQVGSVWLKLRGTLHLAMEYGLYEEVKAIFLELRHLLQTAGFVKDRIHLAAWLRAEAERRQDWAIMHLMTASLAWSYTSFGCNQDIDKANELWSDLIPFLLKVGEPTDCNECREYLRDREDVYPYAEMLVDIYETGTRIAMRCARFDDVREYIRKGRAEIWLLSQSGFLSARLKERFDISFSYHEGMAYYLMSQYERAQALFNDAVERGEMIAWNRLVRGAKSWLATIAIELKDYGVCERILSEIVDNHVLNESRRDVMCHLVKARLLYKQGQAQAQAVSEKKAIAALEKFFEKSSGTYDLDSFRLKPCPV